MERPKVTLNRDCTVSETDFVKLQVKKCTFDETIQAKEAGPRLKRLSGSKATQLLLSMKSCLAKTPV